MGEQGPRRPFSKFSFVEIQFRNRDAPRLVRHGRAVTRNRRVLPGIRRIETERAAARGYTSMTAPVLAEETSLAYLLR